MCTELKYEWCFMMKEYKNLCFSRIVFGDYARYIPLYIYSALKAYPGANIVIFLEKLPDSTIMEAVDLLRKENSGDIIIDVVFLSSVQHLQNTKINGGGFRIARWLIPEKYFIDYQYVLISDVDIFFLKENPDIITFHIDKIKHTGLPFSNSIRPNSKRITGIHFISCEDYYNCVGNIIDKTGLDSNCLLELLKDLPNNDDEEFLYNLLSKSMDISVLESQPYDRPWHGLHLGVARGQIISNIKWTENSSLSKEAAREQLNIFLKDPLLIKILFLCNEESLWNYCGFLNVRSKGSKVFLPEYYALKVFIINLISKYKGVFRK